MNCRRRSSKTCRTWAMCDRGQMCRLYPEGQSNCINVFICADRADRIKRIAERYDVSEKKALDRIKRMDRERKYYYETHTGQEWGSISSHDILLNASLLGIEGTVNVLEGIYKR